MVKKIASGMVLALLALSIVALAYNPSIVHATLTPADMPLVKIETDTSIPGTMKVTVKIYNLTNQFYSTNQQWHPGEELGPYETFGRYNYSLGNLWAFDLRFAWNPLRLQYVSRQVYVPVETRPGGILHSPTLLVQNTVDTVNGKYDVAYSSQAPAASFNAATAKVFQMNFTDLGSGAGVYGLGLDSVDLAIDLVSHPYIQPAIPFRLPPSDHDIAVTKVVPNKLFIGQGSKFTINVTVKNNGIYSETIQYLKLFANNTLINYTVVAITVGQTRIIAFQQNASLAKGRYTLTAYAMPVPGEENALYNTLVDGTVLFTLSGDVDGNKNVNIFDIVKMAGVYGVNYPSPRYDPVCDLDNNGMINIFDIVKAAGNYGKSWH